MDSYFKDFVFTAPVRSETEGKNNYKCLKRSYSIPFSGKLYKTHIYHFLPVTFV